MKGIMIKKKKSRLRKTDSILFCTCLPLQDLPKFKIQSDISHAVVSFGGITECKYLSVMVIIRGIFDLTNIYLLELSREI